MIHSHKLLEVCRQAAFAGGEQLLAWRGRVNPREKSPRDFVTEADLASQHAIHGVIRENFPQHGFVGEEKGPDDAALCKGWQWIVDPLDGTTNYLHGLPYYAVSVAVALDGRVQAGIVWDPVRNECFSAAHGTGATLGTDPLNTSDVQNLNEALLAFSLTSHVLPDDPELQDVTRIAGKCQAIRRFGAAALNLCYVAAGRIDGYWARRLQAWDLAAGSLMVREAGGAIASLGCTEVELSNPGILAAATEPLFLELRAELAV